MLARSTVDLQKQGGDPNNRIGTYDIARSGIGYLFGFFDAQQSSAFGRMMKVLAVPCWIYCTGELKGYRERQVSSLQSARLLCLWPFQLAHHWHVPRVIIRWFRAGSLLCLPMLPILKQVRNFSIISGAARQQMAAEKLFFAYGQAARKG
jgi:hypothetical protein